MQFHFTRHARQKFLRVRKAGFPITRKQIKKIIASPVRVENRHDGTNIAMIVIDKNHVLRVVYRYENDIIIVITFYPGRRKAYEI